MIRSVRIFLALICLFTFTLVPVYASQRQWEEVTNLPVPAVDHNPEPDDVSVYIFDGYVYVTLRQTTPIKLFTILGQLIVQQNLKPGTYRFRIVNRGIYLLKTDTSTRRITI